MSETVTYQYSSFFDQEQPERPITGLIADMDQSEPYELDAAAVFKCKGAGYLVVYVSGCSCWPDRGSTTQVYCENKSAVDRELAVNPNAYRSWAALRDACQNADWKVTYSDIIR